MSKTICFYSTRGPYGCFSNFSRHPFTLAGRRWRTVEHYFQALKFYHHDLDRFERIRAAPSPTAAKRIAWEAGATIRHGWDELRDVVMLTALWAKFAQHVDSGRLLLSTGDARLVEHTSNDSYWGDGGDGSGANRLGELLMQVRAELRG